MARNAMGNNKGTWSREEDAALLSAMEEVTKEIGHVKWCLVAKRLPSRSPKQCRERFVYNLDPKISKAPWTKEEDAFLLFSQKHLGNAWARIASCLPGRTENSTKTRFKSIMRAQKRIWKKYEDEYILAQYQVVGSQWDVIAQGLPGRTKNAIKTRFFFLTEGVGSSRAREVAPSFSTSSNSDDDEDDQNLASSDYVGNPSQALGLSDAELAQISANLSQKLASELGSGVQTATQINQETIKAAIAQSPKSNKRERPGVLKKTCSKSSMVNESGKFILETPKNFISQPKNEITQISPTAITTNHELSSQNKAPKRPKVDVKQEPKISSFQPSFPTSFPTTIPTNLPILFQQQHLIHPRQSIDSSLDLFQHAAVFHENMAPTFIANSFPNSSYLSNERPSFIDFVGSLDCNVNNNFPVPTYAAHDDGFGMNLGEIEPITWNPPYNA